MATLTLIGRIANLRKLETRGKYEATAFDLDIGGLQSWPCAGFGRAAIQARRLPRGGWAQVTGEIADLSLERGRVTGIKISEALDMGDPAIMSRRCEVSAIEIDPAGQRGWIEVVDRDGVTWALEASRDRLSDAASRLEPGAAVEASFLNLPVLMRLAGELRPIMASALVRIAQTPPLRADA